MRIKYYALWLSLICVVIFILQLLIPGFTDLFVLSQAHAAEIWRLVSAIFLHGSLSHLISNLFALALFGTILEGYIGSKKFLTIFFVSGILANTIAIWFYPSSLGASGAIYGVLGALIVIRPMMTVWVSGIPMPMIIAGFVWIGLGIFGVFNPTGVGDIAHLSGIAMGLILGAIWRNWSIKKESIERLRLNEDFMQEWEDRHIKR